MFRNYTFIVILSFLFFSLDAFAKKIDYCKNFPKYIKEAERNFSVCITDPVHGENCGPRGMDVQIFLNSEHKLPHAGGGQLYYEGKVIRENEPNAGTKRLVYLTQAGRKQIVKKYYTPDHYDTFCKIK